MERLRAHDCSWAELVERGIPYEILDKRIDEEEPEGALVISIALNKQMKRP